MGVVGERYLCSASATLAPRPGRVGAHLRWHQGAGEADSRRRARARQQRGLVPGPTAPVVANLGGGPASGWQSFVVVPSGRATVGSAAQAGSVGHGREGGAMLAWGRSRWSLTAKPADRKPQKLAPQAAPVWISGCATSPVGPAAVGNRRVIPQLPLSLAAPAPAGAPARAEGRLPH